MRNNIKYFESVNVGDIIYISKEKAIKLFLNLGTFRCEFNKIYAVTNVIDFSNTKLIFAGNGGSFSIDSKFANCVTLISKERDEKIDIILQN